MKDANGTSASIFHKWFGVPPGIAERAQHQRQERFRAANVAQIKSQIVDDLRAAEAYERNGMLRIADTHRLHVADGVAALVKEGVF